MRSAIGSLLTNIFIISPEEVTLISLKSRLSIENYMLMSHADITHVFFDPLKIE